MSNLSKIAFVLFIFQASAISAQSMLEMRRYSKNKYAMVFGDQVQPMYDGTDIKKSHGPFAILGDKAFYNGNYINAASRYRTAAAQLVKAPGEESLILFQKITLYGRLASIGVEDISNVKIEYFTGLLNTVGLYYQARANYLRAEDMFTKALEIRTDLFGDSGEEYINSLHNLAVLKIKLGEYEAAEAMFKELLPKVKDLYFEKSPEIYAVVLNNNAMLMAELGRTSLALHQIEEALQIGARHFPKNYFDYERMLTNKALMLQDKNEYEKAAGLYREIIKNMERKKWDNHPNYNTVLLNYGALRILMNEENILSFLDDVQKSTRRRYGKRHPLYAKALMNIADYHIRQNSFDLAEPVLREAREAQLASVGSRHKDYLHTMNKLGVCYWQLNNIELANKSFKESVDGYLFQVNTFFNTLSEAEKGNLWRTMKPDITNFMAFAMDNLDNPEILRHAYELQLKTKGLLINGTLRTRKSIINSGDSSLISLFEEYQTIQKTLAIYYSLNLEDIEEDKIDLKDLEAKANELERELVRKTDLITGEIENATMEDIRQTLNPNEAAVEMIRVPVNHGQEKGLVKYGALVITKNKLSPDLVVLDKGKDLEGQWLKFYKNAIQLRVDDDRSYSHYWEPIGSKLSGIDRIYLSLDGVYNTINLNTLKVPDMGYLLEYMDILVLPSTRALAKRTDGQSMADYRKKAVLFGSPNFGNDAVIAPLPGTREEVNTIKELLASREIPTSIYIEEEATEDQFADLNNPTLLHIATHGFFLSDVDISSNASVGINLSKARENPLLRSGLLFTGAANTFGNHQGISTTYNGVLNAFKVMNLNLSGTDLVIMSACETGSGEVVNGEGVYGLSRSFQVAGADKILMSLWKVDDTATMYLMVSFYNHLLEENNVQKAFLNAQRAVKEKYPDPYYWGAFVLIN